MQKENVLNERMDLLSKREWDLPAIEKRFRDIEKNGIPKKEPMTREIALQNKEEILDRVQTRAEEYCYLTRNCAKGSALALFEEFGVGNMEMIRALTPFPGLGMTGGICGPVTGGLATLGLFFSDEDPADFKNPWSYIAGRDYLQRFEKALGSLLCPDIQITIVGKSYDPFAGPEELEAYYAAGVREKCPLAPGIGARTTAEIIIETLENNQ
jgi:C_GCAxxG_C_C family probable redox protein